MRSVNVLILVGLFLFSGVCFCQRAYPDSTLFSGQKTIENTWETCIHSTKSVSGGLLLTITFANEASGSFFLDGKKKMEFERQKEISIGGLLPTISFTYEASGGFFFDGKKKMEFERQKEISISGSLSSGRHPFKIVVSAPATLTRIDSWQGVELCP